MALSDIRSEMNSERKRDKHNKLVKVTKTCNTAKVKAKHDKHLADEQLKSIEDCWHQAHGVKVKKINEPEINFE